MFQQTQHPYCKEQQANPLKPSGHYMYRQWSLYAPPGLALKIPRSAHTLYLCVLCGSRNKRRLFPYTTLTDWFLNAFAKLRKANISFVMSVLRTHGTGRT